VTTSDFTPTHAVLLRRAWLGLWPLAKIVAELSPHRPAEILRQIELMLATPRPVVNGEWTELERVFLALPGRVERLPRSALGYRLDGRPASLQQVVAAANVFLARMGYEPVHYPAANAVRGSDC
jgi:hypothetical protein